MVIDSLEMIQIFDNFYQINKRHDFTFGILDKAENPIETLLTKNSDIGLMCCFDYVFSNFKSISAKVDHF